MFACDLFSFLLLVFDVTLFRVNVYMFYICIWDFIHIFVFWYEFVYIDMSIYIYIYCVVYIYGFAYL